MVERDVLKCDVEFAVTDKVPVISLELNDANRKFTDLPFHWNDPITVAAEAATRFLGRVDSLSPDYTKEGARVLTVKGRHTGSGALEDYVANLQVSGTPKAIVEAIIARYTSMRGTTYTNDPVITIASNLAPDDITMAFDWRRKNFWKMLMDLEEALGAPILEGGKNEFYDFYFDPATVGNFYFVPMGSVDSAVVIAESTETLKAKRNLDALPLKNNIYLWCNATAGAVPFEMQPGWNKAQHYEPAVTEITDPWTEGNAADYSTGTGPGGTVDVDDYTYVPGEQIGVGAKCIRIHGTTPYIGGTEQQYAYWSMKFAHGEAFHTKLAGFTNQDPNDMLNLLNETHMAESMGEVAAISFYLKDFINPLLGAWQFVLECVDVDDNVVRGGQMTARATGGVWYWLTQEWLNPTISIGATASWALKMGTSFDWTSIKELRFVLGGQKAAFDFYFDGFRFIKPLIANAVYLSGEPREKSCRSIVLAKEKIINYESALLIAKALLEQQKKANAYWEIENLGRVDIPSGAKFKIGALELLMRDERWSMTKADGWRISGRALERT